MLIHHFDRHVALTRAVLVAIDTCGFRFPTDLTGGAFHSLGKRQTGIGSTEVGPTEVIPLKSGKFKSKL